MQSMQSMQGMQGMQAKQGGQGGQGGQSSLQKGKPGILWIKEGDSLKPRRVRTGLSDGLNTEVKGRIKEGEEVVVSMTATQAQTTGQQQQQNPFMPQPPRGSRGGR
jgi:hypothetical protein